MKTSMLISKGFKVENNAGIEVGIVTGYHNNKHTHEYQVFDLKKPVPNVGTIGVNDKDEFAIAFKTDFTAMFSMAVYLDGVNVEQTNGITNINQIEESKRDDYFSHTGTFICENPYQSLVYLYRFCQQNGENRLFTFTTAITKFHWPAVVL